MLRNSMRDVSICEAPIFKLLNNHLNFLSQSTRTKLRLYAKFHYFLTIFGIYLFIYFCLEKAFKPYKIANDQKRVSSHEVSL
jgi:hypothetical protein